VPPGRSGTTSRADGPCLCRGSGSGTPVHLARHVSLARSDGPCRLWAVPGRLAIYSGDDENRAGMSERAVLPFLLLDGYVRKCIQLIRRQGFDAETI
jgi:hypothetical protein